MLRVVVDRPESGEVMGGRVLVGQGALHHVVIAGQLVALVLQVALLLMVLLLLLLLLVVVVLLLLLLLLVVIGRHLGSQAGR